MKNVPLLVSVEKIVKCLGIDLKKAIAIIKDKEIKQK
jgi:hypothetical protein